MRSLPATTHPRRFPQPTTYQQIMARFEATHRTANPQALPAAPAEPAAAGGAAVAGTAAGVRAAAATASVAGGGEPVGGGQPAAKRARQAAAPQLQQGAAAQRIRLRHINGDELLLRALPGEKWSTVARMYCFLTGRAPDETRFVFEGAPCTPDETIERLGLVDGDTVDVFDQQVGD